MKGKTFVSLIGLAVSFQTAIQSHSQGWLYLNNYSSNPSPIISNGPGGAGVPGTGISVNFTVGLYYALGTVTVAADPTGVALPSSLGPLTLGTGQGSTTPIGVPGYFFSTYPWQVPGWSSGVITLMIVAYNGMDYTSSVERGHSAPFVMTPSLNPQVPPFVGTYMPPFSIPVPEPSFSTLCLLAAATVVAAFRWRRRAVSI